MSDGIRVGLLCITALLPVVIALLSFIYAAESGGLNSWMRLPAALLWLVAVAVFAGFGVDSQSYFVAQGHGSEPIAGYWGFGGLLTVLSALTMFFAAVE